MTKAKKKTVIKLEPNKPTKESSEAFHSIMKASVMGNPTPNKINPKAKKELFGGAAIYLNQKRKDTGGLWYFLFGGHCFGVEYEFVFEVKAKDLTTAQEIANETASNECAVQFEIKKTEK